MKVVVMTMDNLYILLQRDAQIQRRIALLRLLNDIPETLSPQLIMERLSCTMPTLREDIEVLNTTFTDQLEIQISKQGIISFLYSKNISVDTLINELIKDTFPYQIIDGILHERFENIQDAMGKLATSRTNFLRTIWHMNEILENYHIRISTKRELVFAGNEEDIRVFLFMFYSEFGDRNIVGKDSGQILKGLLNLANDKDQLMHYCHFSLAICVPIIDIRWKNGHFVTLQQGIEQRVHNQVGLAELKEELRKFYLANYGIFLPNDELVWAFITSVHSISYSNSPSLSTDQESKTYYYCHEAPEELVEEVMSFVKDNFSSRLIETDVMKIVGAFLINSIALTAVTPVYGKGSPKLKGLIENLYSGLYQKWLKIVENIPENSLLAPLNTESIARRLAIFEASFRRQYHGSNGIYVLFAFQGEAGLDHYLVQWSKVLLGENIKADYFLEEMLDEQKVLEIKPDVVVCNYDIWFEQSDCSLIRVSNFPTLHEWKSIRDVFDELLF